MNRIFVDVIKLQWDYWGGSDPIWLISFEEEENSTWRHGCTAVWSCKDRDKDWIYAARNCGMPSIPSHKQKLGRGKEVFFLRATGDSIAMPTAWFQTSSFENWGWIDFYCFKPPCLWSFVMAALGNWYIPSSPVFLISPCVLFITVVPVLIALFCCVFRPSLCTSPGTLDPSVLWALAACPTSWLH